MPRCIDLFVFDLAGTVVRDEHQVLDAFLAAARAFEVPVAESLLRERMGWHKQRVFETVLAEAGRDVAPAAAMARRFEEEYAAIVSERPLQPTNGALQVLQELAAAGVKIAFNTGFSRSTADLVLRAVGLHHLPSVASSEVRAGRPAPDLILRAMELCGVEDPARVGVAGDTPADLAAGMAARARFVVGVGCGTHTLLELREFPHTHLVADLTELPALVLQA